ATGGALSVSADVDNDAGGRVEGDLLRSARSGAVVALSRLAAHARTTGSLVAVDITQGAGILPFNLREIPFDFVCGSTLKW
ncbi:hypothetical protein AB4Y33_43260, partial [Paraburkholderia sp. BR14319]